VTFILPAPRPSSITTRSPCTRARPTRHRALSPSPHDVHLWRERQPRDLCLTASSESFGLSTYISPRKKPDFSPCSASALFVTFYSFRLIEPRCPDVSEGMLRLCNCWFGVGKEMVFFYRPNCDSMDDSDRNICSTPHGAASIYRTNCGTPIRHTFS